VGEPWSYVEPCCGSASIALALLGARRPLVPYQGSKWRFRDRLISRFGEAGVSGSPASITLWDAGPWGEVAPLLFRPEARARVIERLGALAAEDARAVYQRLNYAPVSEDPHDRAAEFLFLQRLSYSGKAVGTRAGCWVSPGFNTSSAYGLPGTDRFGAVKPMIPSLLGVLAGYARSLAPAAVDGGRRSAPAPDGPTARRTIVYIDPPYVCSTAYPDGALSRDEVVALAVRWRDAGASVFVSEGEPVVALADRGWGTRLLDDGRGDTSPFRGKQQEWLTYAVAP
jgi:hypothetical protein